MYGSDITIETDHKNIIQRDLKYPRLLHCRLLIDYFLPKLVYLPRKSHLAADKLSHLLLLTFHRSQEIFTHEVLREFLLFYPDDIDAFPLGFDIIYTSQ